MRNYSKLVVELKVEKDRLAEMGQTKAELISRVATPENISDWLSKADAGIDLRSAVREYQAANSQEVGPENSEQIEQAPPHAGVHELSPIPYPTGTVQQDGPFPALPEDFAVAPEVWEQGCFAVAHYQPTILLGPTGCGKSELVRAIAKAFGREFESFDFGQMLDPRGSLIGLTHLKNGATEFVPSRFLRDREKIT